MTQENERAPGYKQRQRKVMLLGKVVWADPELIPLLTALNEVGLRTRSHCYGHDNNPAWVTIRLEGIVGIEVRTEGDYNELLLTWWPEQKGNKNEMGSITG